MTMKAEKYLEWIREGGYLLGDEYIELLRQADGIRRERKAPWLGHAHVDLAFRRMTGRAVRRAA